MQQDIFGWVTDDGHSAQPRKLLLLTGPAGSGKTTIMNTIGEQLNETGSLAAAFFFSSFAGSLERSTKGRFVTTLVYQFIQHDCFQTVREHVLFSISKHPAILKMSLKEQMKVLILKPLRALPAPPDASPPPKVILVDGLDECGQKSPASSDQSEHIESRMSREQDQTEILGILLDALKDPAFPFRVIIASRPEPAIRHFFSTSAADHTLEIFLDNKYNPDADIKLFLTSHFSRIRRKYAHLPPSWPGEDAIAKLVGNASGQMIYAATAIRFVETPSNPPRVQLETILESSLSLISHSHRPGPSNPFGPLDSLYAQILNSTPDPILAINWLKAYHLLDIQSGDSAWFFNRICESSDGEVEHLFANMAALVRIDDNRDNLAAQYTFYHKSFQDFFEDASRYGVYLAVSEAESRDWIIGRFLETFESACAFDTISCYTLITLTQGRGLPLHMQSPSASFARKLWHCGTRCRGCHLPNHTTSDFWLAMRIGGLLVLTYHPTTAGHSLGSCSLFLIIRFVQFIPVKSQHDDIPTRQCSPFLPCRPTCKRWRKLILAKWKGFREAGIATSIPFPKQFTLLLDRFGIKRIQPLEHVVVRITS